MDMDLAKMKEYLENLSEFRDSEINRNYWRMMLVNSFPKIVE